MVWPLSSALPTIYSLQYHQGCTDYPFFVLSSLLFLSWRGLPVGGGVVEGEEVCPFLFLSPPHMTNGPLKNNSTMCCHGQERRGRGDPLLLLLRLDEFWFGFLSEWQQRPQSSSHCSAPAFIFPSSVSQSGWREAGGTGLSPSPAVSDLLGL